MFIAAYTFDYSLLCKRKDWNRGLQTVIITPLWVNAPKVLIFFIWNSAQGKVAP